MDSCLPASAKEKGNQHGKQTENTYRATEEGDDARGDGPGGIIGLLGSLLVTSAGQASATNHQPQASVNGNVAAARGYRQ